MLSRQIASKLRGYETPFYLYDMALLRQTLESVVYESKKYGYKVHYAIKANYDDHLLAVIREYGLGIDCASGNELRKAIESDRQSVRAAKEAWQNASGKEASESTFKRFLSALAQDIDV